MIVQSDLERLKAWITTYDGADLLSKLRVDYTGNLPGEFGVFPGGLLETGRMEYIDGDVTVYNQYNFALYIVFAKEPGDEAGALVNADWVMDFQRWVQRQSATGKAPKFGNVDRDEEVIRAQNGALYDADAEGLAMYMVQLTASFHTNYSEE